MEYLYSVLLLCDTSTVQYSYPVLVRDYSCTSRPINSNSNINMNMNITVLVLVLVACWA